LENEEDETDTMNEKIVKIYTDGACSGNQNDENTGGWGAVLEYGTSAREIYGGESNTTNNRMEMKALISAFEALSREGLSIQVFCDSSYLMECFRKKWYEKWLVNGWLTAKKDPVENRDLWEKLLPFLSRHDISFFRVKGHINIDYQTEANIKKHFEKFREWNGAEFTFEEFIHVTEMNNLADKLANIGIRETLESS